jgi:IS1 family transposase
MCSRTFIEPHEKLLDKMRVPEAKAIQCLHLLMEGMSIRSTERITGIHHTTILTLLVLAGERCENLMKRRIHKVAVKDVQADEIWGFVWCKEKTKNRLGLGDEVGDAYCFVAIERNTKLVLCWHLGHRTTEDTETFIEKLRRATTGKFQLLTYGWPSYPDAVSLSLGVRVSYAQIIKTYHAAHPSQSPEGERRYSPSRVLEIAKVPRIGEPNPDLICTSHIERQNLTIRMHIRRLTRLTNAFSKKWENLRAALALHFAYYNFCCLHSTIRCTPAMEAGITNHIWEIRELLAA